MEKILDRVSGSAESTNYLSLLPIELHRRVTLLNLINQRQRIRVSLNEIKAIVRKPPQYYGTHRHKYFLFRRSQKMYPDDPELRYKIVAFAEIYLQDEEEDEPYDKSWDEMDRDCYIEFHPWHKIEFEWYCS
jgi:hypothetical protein